MDDREVLGRADQILREAGLFPEDPTTENFFHYAQQVSECVKDWSSSKRANNEWLMPWAESFRKLYDNFDRIVEADPMLLYQPANRASQEFHQSDAFIRYFRAGNRTSKTQSGYAEHYFLTTNQHKWRYFPGGAHSTFIIGVNFSKYCPAVFEKKFLTGEEGNPLSPMFPKNGKWLHRYDERRHEIQIACEKCANAGRAKTCTHQKSTIRLFSDTEGWRLTQLHNEGPPKNRVDPDNQESPQFVSLHEIDQFEAGLVPPERIKMSMTIMDEFEVESRVYGRPAPLAKNPVFDRKALADMRREIKTPLRGDLQVTEDVLAVDIVDTTRMELLDAPDGPLRVWEKPEQGGYYISRHRKRPYGARCELCIRIKGVRHKSVAKA